MFVFVIGLAWAGCNTFQFIALAISEPGAGSDVAGLVCTAKRSGDTYTVNGYVFYRVGVAYPDRFL